MRTVKDNGELKEILGEATRSQPEWWLNGDPWIEGSVSVRSQGIYMLGSLKFFRVSCQINMMQANVDVSFRLKGHKGMGRRINYMVASDVIVFD